MDISKIADHICVFGTVLRETVVKDDESRDVRRYSSGIQDWEETGYPLARGMATD